ncbi:hypothetical protein [Aequorivita antarctica]|uniref:Uncharacterized protein n=1 Tax=Aequorivita antarctica TaxID=153266 RepID=A0A5C6YVF6_9FLAO|nr:hypothetical protein [Aequorivita antarctica]TXD71578.1 hypothetical protein ESU54_16275 [Aequorivita antarctica]SRX75278.1 hypothetical protein AEQU3_02272 [Aequorivita antarctica]
MKDSLIEIDIEKYSEIKSLIFLDSDQKFFVGSFTGGYKYGSLGNNDGLYIYSKLVAVYFLYDTLSALVLDFRNLDYSFGNTLLKSLNFFYETCSDDDEKLKKIAVIVSQKNKIAIEELLRLVKENNCVIFNDYDKALAFASLEATKYLTNE